MEPSLTGGGGEREENDGRGSGDNIPGNVEHPLLNELVLAVLFKKLVFVNHDDSSKSKSHHLAELRPVCKAWNREISRMIRNKTRINVKNLVAAYPKGLGWTATTTTGEDQDGMDFQYGAPMPEVIGTFENLTVTIDNCTDLQDTSVVQWFEVMGSSVKSLRFVCSFNCCHQNRFLENILKEWCPNLESLTLQGVFYCKSLIENSYFVQPSSLNQCKFLKEFVLVFDGLKDIVRMDTCGRTIEYLATPEDQPFQKFADTQELFDARSKFVKDLAMYVHKAGEPGTTNSKETELLNKLVRNQRPSSHIGLASLDGMTPRTFGPHVADFFQGKFSCDRDYENDGGIFAQLMKMSKIEKCVVQKSIVGYEWFFFEMFPMLFFRPNLWRSTLQHFECLGHCPVMIAVHLNWASPDPPTRNIFSKVGFPLKRLKLNKGFTGYMERLDQDCMVRTLSACAGTLEELEFGWALNQYQVGLITLPVLPNLKLLVVQCGGYRMIKVTSEDILTKLPKLERCVVKLGSIYEGLVVVPASFFQDGNGGGGGRHPLKELKLLDEFVDENDIGRMVTRFPNLKIVDLSIAKESGEGYKAFWEKMAELPLQQVKLSFWAKVESSMDKPYELYEKAIENNIEEFKELQRLELVHGASHPIPLTSSLVKGFAKAVKLRCLKFTNFELVGNVVEEIKNAIPDVVVQICVASAKEDEETTQ